MQKGARSVIVHMRRHYLRRPAVCTACSDRAVRTFSSSSSSSRLRWKGRATSEGTKTFLQESNLALFHKFEKSSLFINPIVHGAPLFFKPIEEPEYYRALALQAVLVNRSNCIVAYRHHHKTASSPFNLSSSAIANSEPYSLPGIADVSAESDGAITREQLVLVAHLGLPSTKEDIFLRLESAKAQCFVEHFDFALFEVRHGPPPPSFA